MPKSYSITPTTPEEKAAAAYHKTWRAKNPDYKPPQRPRDKPPPIVRSRCESCRRLFVPADAQVVCTGCRKGAATRARVIAMTRARLAQAGRSFATLLP